MVEGRQLALSQTLDDRHDGGVDEAEAQIGIASEQFADSRIVGAYPETARSGTIGCTLRCRWRRSAAALPTGSLGQFDRRVLAAGVDHFGRYRAWVAGDVDVVFDGHIFECAVGVVHHHL